MYVFLHEATGLLDSCSIGREHADSLGRGLERALQGRRRVLWAVCGDRSMAKDSNRSLCGIYCALDCAQDRDAMSKRPDS